MDSATCTVMLIDNDKKEALVTASVGLPAGSKRKRVKLNLPVIHKLLETGQPLLLSDIDRQEPSIRQISCDPISRHLPTYDARWADWRDNAKRKHIIHPMEVSACNLLAERADSPRKRPPVRKDRATLTAGPGVTHYRCSHRIELRPQGDLEHHPAPDHHPA
jgi:hypothetical protein